MKKLLLVNLCLFSLAACNEPKPREYVYIPPDTRALMNKSLASLGDPKLIEILKNQLCEKEESQQTIWDEALAQRIPIKKEYRIQETIWKFCDGTEESQGLRRIDPFLKRVRVPAPNIDVQDINFVEIENQRTCSIVRANVYNTNPLTQNPHDNPAVQKILDFYTPAVFTNGNTEFSLNDLKFQWSDQLNVVNGVNAVTIRFYGTCFKPKNGDTKNCLIADLLASQELILDVNITEKEIPGTNVSNMCHPVK